MYINTSDVNSHIFAVPALCTHNSNNDNNNIYTYARVFIYLYVHSIKCVAKTVFIERSNAMARALPAGHVLYDKVMRFDASVEDSDRRAGGRGQISRRIRDRDLVKSSMESVYNIVIFIIILVGKEITDYRLCLYNII